MNRFQRSVALFLLLLGCSLYAAAQERSEGASPQKSQPVPRSDVESSSNSTKIDLSPPPNDEKTHPYSGIADDISEFRRYDPHKAEKHVEVGDYYFKQKNYRAAVSRYQEALEWKPDDAVATLHLARALEKTGDLEEARASYQEYLRILPQGPGAEESKKSLERLSKREPEPKSAASKTTTK